MLPNLVGKSFGGWISFTTEPGDPIEHKFSISGTRMTDVITDSQGNVYVSGTFGGADKRNDGFFAKFDSEGKFIWRTDFIKELFDYPEGGIIIDEDRGIVYVHVTMDDIGVRNGYTFLYSLQISDGKINWITKLSDERSTAASISIDGEGNLISLVGYFLVKTSPMGKIIQTKLLPGLSDTAVFGNSLLLAGEELSSDNEDGSLALIKMFNKGWDEKWKYLRKDEKFSRYSVLNIVVFLEDSLLFSSERARSSGNIFYAESYVACYRITPQGLQMEWRNFFSNDLAVSLRKWNAHQIITFPLKGYETGLSCPVVFDFSGKIVKKIDSTAGRITKGLNEECLIANWNSSLMVY